MAPPSMFDRPLARDRRAVLSWYGAQLSRHGFTPKGLGWNRPESQRLRFEALLELGDFRGRTVLDAGCGFGDFLAFLNNAGAAPRRYVGLDMCPEMVSRCKERFSGGSASFFCADVLCFEPEQSFDLVVASGLFGLRSECSRERIAPTLRRLYSWADIGLAANFLSRLSPRHAKTGCYVDPRRVWNIATALTPAVRLRHDYLPNDFTIYLRKTPAWQPEKNGSLKGERQ